VNKLKVYLFACNSKTSSKSYILQAMLTRSKGRPFEHPQLVVPSLVPPPPPPEAKGAEGETPEAMIAPDEQVLAHMTDRQKMDLVKKLYRQLDFSASFSGIVNLQRAIFLEKGLHISRKLISLAVNEIPSYVQVS